MNPTLFTSATNALPAISILVLNWNGQAYLKKSLPALLRLDYPDFQVLLIDNASTDDSMTLVRQQFPRVKLHCNDKNLGFAAGNNVGLRQIETDFAILVNPDVVVARDWLRKLITPMLEDETIGIAGCKLYYPDGILIQHAGGYISYPQALPGHYGLNEQDQGQHDQLCDTDYVIGAALAIKRKVIDEIGLLDEGYFLFFEDADWCLRARRAGYRVIYVPQATAVHFESVVTDKSSRVYLQHMHTSRWRFLLKHYNPNDIVKDTLPAERAWLAKRTSKERQALARAYRATLKDLPAIWKARVQHGGSVVKEVTENQKGQIAEKLQVLQTAAAQPSQSSPVTAPDGETGARFTRPPGVIDQLKTKWRIQERSFVSHVPIVGPLIARFRSAWNSVAAKWYVLSLFQQQNEFNALVVQRLQAMEDFEELRARLEELDTRAIDTDRDTTALAREVGELTYAVVRLDKRLAKLEARLKNDS